MVGHSAGCQLKLDDPAFPAHQCLLELRDGKLRLHNWSDENETRVNGSAVPEEAALDLSDRVEFRGYSLSFQRHDSSAELRQPIEQPREPQQAATDDVPTHDRVYSQTSRLETETAEPESSTAPKLPTAAEPKKEPGPLRAVEDSTIALLHNELACLQKELDERDQTIAELTAPRKQETTAPQPSNGRVDDLLRELHAGDERIATLESELTLLEELRAAELEEKKQIDDWVNDIERRLALREEETEAELEALRDRLASEKHERVATQAKADQGLAGGDDASSQLHDTLMVLRRDHEALKEKHQQAIERCAELEKACESLRESTSEDAIEERINEAVRLERLQISQEAGSCFSQRA